MSNVHTISSLANSYADRKLAHQQLNEPERVLLRKRVIYDFLVTAFNVTTIATIITVALAIFVSSPLFIMLFIVMHSTRRAFMNEVDRTGMPPVQQQLANANLLNRIANVDPIARRAEIAAHLEINDAIWSPVNYQLLNFRIWMRWTPTQAAAVDAAAQVEGGQLANVPAAH